MEKVKKIYRGNSGRKEWMLIIRSVSGMGIFYLILSIAKSKLDIGFVGSGYLQIAAWVIFAVHFIVSVLSIYVLKKRCLKVLDTEIIFVPGGLLSKQKIAVPISKIEACVKRTRLTQLLLSDTIDLMVCVGTDGGAFYLEDVPEKQGEEAFRLIMDMIK